MLVSVRMLLVSAYVPHEDKVLKNLTSDGGEADRSTICS